MIFLPGGRAGTENLGNNGIVLDQCREFAKNKMVTAICAAPSILIGLGLLEGKKAACHPDYEDKMTGAILTGESVSVDGNIITGQSLGATFPFAFTLASYLSGEGKAEEIKETICYNAVISTEANQDNW